MRQSLKALAALLVVLLVGSQLLAALHQLLVRHEVCAEHGELIHVAAHVETRSASRSASERSAFVAARAGHAHDHCAVLASAHEKRASVARTDTTIAAAPIAPRVSVLATGAEPRGGIDVLSVAPKQSPPV